MKVALLLLALAACEHAESTTDKKPPAPRKPDPVQQARAEFELLAPDFAAGTSKLYSRGAFLPDGTLEDGLDEGDFIGRLRALFGPRDGDDYVLRHKATGFIVTAYSGDSGPSYGGAQTAEDAGRQARMKADPVLQGDRPTPIDAHAYHVYERHLDDAIAGPERAAVIARLDALVSMVPPADYSETKFYEDEPTVYRVGAKGGQSFSDDVPVAEGMAFLVDRAKKATGFDGDVDLITYYLAHEDELAPHRPEALAALAHLTELAKHEPDKEMRDLLNEQVRDYKKQLR